MKRHLILLVSTLALLGSSAIAQTKVPALINYQGNVRNAGPWGNLPNDPRVRAIYESARRALLSPSCNPLKVPADKLQTVMASTFRFSPRGLVR